MPAAGFLAFQGRLNLVGVSIAGAVGCLIGSAIAYWIGAVGGRPVLLRYGKYVLISQHDADRADEWFARHGDATIFFTRLMPIVRTFISLPAGIARMDFRKFLIFTFLGSLPWCFALALAGYKLGEHWRDVGSALHKYDLVIGVAIVLLIALFLYRHLRQPERAPDRDVRQPSRR
jgi:membrane protein DedA with SNARE-associated domain